MAKTSRDARRHIRAIEKLFSEGAIIAKTEYQNLVLAYKNQKYLKQSMQRLIENKFITDHGDKFTLTSKGLWRFRKVVEIKRSPKIQWDRRWRIVSFDVPGGYSRARDMLRGLLKQFNFYPLQKSVWICPNSIAADFWKLVVEENLHRYCKAMTVEMIEGDDYLKKHFNLK